MLERDRCGRAFKSLRGSSLKAGFKNCKKLGTGSIYAGLQNFRSKVAGICLPKRDGGKYPKNRNSNGALA
jgi:hypothetical protein